MPRVKLSEFRAKTIVNNQLGTEYKGFSYDTEKDDVSKIEKNIDSEKPYVVKVDQGIKKRFKQGLIKLNVVGVDQISDAIFELNKKGFNHFLVEEMIPHNDGDERYLAIERTVKGTVVYYSKMGGVNIEDSAHDVSMDLITDGDDVKNIAEKIDLEPDYFGKILEAFDINYFSFLEINPLVISFKNPYMLDIASEVDSVSEFFVNTWSLNDVRTPAGDKTEEEKNIDKLSEKSQASFKLVVLNPNGSIFMLLSGGGASVVLADEVYNLGNGRELANYGEYSGNPNEEETFIYTKNILSLLLKSSAKDKVLIIGGGVANFTDVRVTFRGIIKALKEVEKELSEQGIRIYVRRGGPHQKEGLELMRNFMETNGIGGETYGPELVLTEIVSMALKSH